MERACGRCLSGVSRRSPRVGSAVAVRATPRNLLKRRCTAPLTAPVPFAPGWGAWSEEVPGSSYPVIHRYLKGTATPPVEFLEAASDILNVRSAWLAFGEGPRDEEEARLASQSFRVEEQRVAISPVQQAADVLGHQGRQPNERQYAAVDRFHAKLWDADFPESPWGDDEGNRIAILVAAFEFLVAADASAVEIGDARADDRDPKIDRDLLLSASVASPGWYVVWSDAVLHAFSLRVKGLGERSGRYGDSHGLVSARQLRSEPARTEELSLFAIPTSGSNPEPSSGA